MFKYVAVLSCFSWTSKTLSHYDCIGKTCSLVRRQHIEFYVFLVKNFFIRDFSQMFVYVNRIYYLCLFFCCCETVFLLSFALALCPHSTFVCLLVFRFIHYCISMPSKWFMRQMFGGFLISAFNRIQHHQKKAIEARFLCSGLGVAIGTVKFDDLN